MSRSSFLNSTVGEYRLVDFLGAGGMGEVFRATHAKIGRVAAIKILTDASSRGEFVERFFNEARIQASLQHPNIATLYDFLEHQGRPCIVMEYVDGVTLADHIRLHGALPFAESVRIFKLIVGAIDYVHRNGVIHRDIKSNNIKISSASHVKLLDFGIAKGQTSMSLTMTGGVIGTPSYLSPEQLRGAVADARTDIWALGVLLYEMMTGRLPFEASTLGELCDKIGGAIYPPAEQLNAAVPRDVSQIIARCLKKNPADRYQSAHDLFQHVESLNLRATQAAPPPQQRGAAELTAAYQKNSTPRQADYGHGGGVFVDGGSTAGGDSPAAHRPWVHRHWKMVAAGSTLLGLLALIAVTVAVFLALGGGGTAADPVQNGNVAVVINNNAARPVAMKIVTIDVDEGRAQVYLDSRLVGTTPHKLEARIGDRVKLMLRRDGYADKNVDLDISPNKPVYTISMTRQ